MLALVIGCHAARTNVAKCLRACGFTVLCRSLPEGTTACMSGACTRVMVGPVGPAAISRVVDQLVPFRVRVTVLSSEFDLWRYASAASSVRAEGKVFTL